MDLMTHDGYTAKIEYDGDFDLFRGVILGLSGYADFFGDSPKALKKEFKKSLDVYLESCREEGIEPKKNYSGKFNVRFDPVDHEMFSIQAASEGLSLNEWLKQSARERVHNA